MKARELVSAASCWRSCTEVIWMTVSGYIEEKIEIPKDVKVTMDGQKLTVKGPNGT